MRLFRSPLGFGIIRIVLVLLSLPVPGFAQDYGFSIDGAFESATASSGAYNTGGSVVVQGFTINIPSNLQVQFPATFVSWKDFVAGSGSLKGYEMSVVGNVVGGTHIAAQVSISQFFFADGSGFIDSVNFDGTMKIAGGPVIRLNDPKAVYSAGFTGAPFFTADADNPSISSFSGFPMCVPRSADDNLCPQSNRPGTNKQGTITLSPPASLVMAPFQKGDFVEFSGFRSGGEVIVWSVVATNIQIATTGVPTYIRLEDVLIGVFSTDPNVEVARHRFVGYTSDQSNGVNPIQIMALDVDPCTGVQTERLLGTGQTRAGQPRNKFDITIQDLAAGKYTREYRIKTSSGNATTRNGVVAGQYTSPVSEWIQPELAVPGNPPPVNQFGDMTFLSQGLGRDEAGNLWGPLNPFPQSGVAVFDTTKCANTPPPAQSSPAAPPPPPPTADTVAMTAATWTSSGSGTLVVTCTSSEKTNAKVQMKLTVVNQDGTNSFGMGESGSGVWNFNQRRISRPTRVTCTSLLGGTASRTNL